MLNFLDQIIKSQINNWSSQFKPTKRIHHSKKEKELEIVKPILVSPDQIFSCDRKPNQNRR